MFMTLAWALVGAATRGRGGNGPVGWVFLALFAVLFVLSFYRLRRGGPGPAVNWIPRRFRQRLNRTYAEHGWQEPFDSAGNRRTDRPAI